MTFAFLSNYMSAKGIEVVKVKRGLYTMKGLTFHSVKELQSHIVSFF